MDYRPDWINGTDEPAVAVLVSNTLSKMARRAEQITDEVSKIKQRVDRMIHSFERNHAVLSSWQGPEPDMEFMENMDELENVLHDHDKKRKYKEKLTVFIVGFQETCGQRRHLLTQLQEFFSIYSNVNELEGDLYLEQPSMDMDGIALQVTGAVRSAEAAMSRLTELHKVVMSHLGQAVSAGTQAKRKPSDDRGRKKLEKLLDQARQDIRQLTDQLLQTQEELTLKTQQMKELQKQNETRVMEIHHVKSQMEVTKKSLQILQEETVIQRSLLETEIRRQAGQLEVLESQKALKEQLTDSSTQWEIIDCSDENITANNEDANLEESMETAQETPLTDINHNHNNTEGVTMELGSINTDNNIMDDMTKPESKEFTGPSFSEFGENISTASLTPIPDEDNPVHTLSNVEDNSTSQYLSANQSCMRPPSLPTVQNDQSDNDGSQLNFATSFDVPQEISPPYLTNEKSQSAIFQPNSQERTNHSNVSFTLPDNGSDTTAPHNEADQVNHANSSSRRYNLISNEAAESIQANKSEINHLIPNNRSTSILLLKRDEDINPMISTDIPNTDTRLKNPILDENTNRVPGADDVIVASTDNTYNTSVSEPDRDANDNISFTSTDKKFDSLPLIHRSTELNTLSDSIPSFTTLPVTNINITTDQSLCTTSNSLTEAHPPESPEAKVTENETEKSMVSMSADSRHQSSEPLSNTLLETENESRPTFHSLEEEAAIVETSDNGDHHTELLGLSERLHKCMREIRDLLITKGFLFLADVLSEGIQDESQYGLSANLIQLENFPAVLQSLLHDITRKSTESKDLTNGHSPDSVIRKEEDRNKINSSQPMKHTEDESHKCHGPSMKTDLSCDFVTSSLIFTRTDEEHNKRELQWARCQGRIPIHIYQDTSRMMSKYRILSQERLQSLVWGYVQYISWNSAENLLRRQCLSRPQITPVLYKLQKQRDQVFLQWRHKLLHNQKQRLRISVDLNQTLQGVHEDTGIFLIKPLISWPGRPVLENRKQIYSNKKTVQHSSLPSLSQNGITCYGIPRTHVTKKWKYMHTHTELKPLVVTPKLLEMDIHRYLCEECCVMSQLRSSLHESHLKHASAQRKLIHVKRTAAFPAL